MTGLDFIAAGVTVERGIDGRLRVLGPADRADLLEDLRFEVEMRVELDFDALVVDSERSADRQSTAAEVVKVRRRDYHCDHCGDAIGHGLNPSKPCPLCPDRCLRQTGGMCMLCALARQKQLDAKGAA